MPLLRASAALCALSVLCFSVLCFSACAPGTVDITDKPATDDSADSAVDTGAQLAACMEALVTYDFEGDDQGFDSEETDDGFDDPWDHGEPEDQSCHSGDECWVTNRRGEYDDCEAGALVSPTLDLSACAGQTVSLTFWHLYRLEDESNGTWYDGGLVQLSSDGGGSWQETDPEPGYTGDIFGNYSECERDASMDGMQGWSGRIDGDDWEQVTITLDDAMLTSEFAFRFLFASDRGVVDEGWYVDDVELSLQ